jgi:hypothetical protein
MAYYAVAYGHVIRYEQADQESEAARLAFGMVDTRRMTVRKLPKSPKYLSHAKLFAENQELAKRHFHKTGSTVSGFENLPGIKNVHWTQCPLCRFPITTEPAAGGLDDRICSECEPKYATLTEAEHVEMSISAIREKLGIKMK